MNLRVSDHAVLRWLERVEGVNVNAIRRRIRRAVIRGAGEGADAVTLDGVKYHLKRQDGETVVVSTWSQQRRPHLAEPRMGPDAELESGAAE